jgi:hypothetical protein
LDGSGSPEGFAFVAGKMFVGVGGPPGKVMKIDPSTMQVLGMWTLPGGIENHNFTTDGTNLFVLGVPERDVEEDKYFKVSTSLNLLGTITFPWTGIRGGNVYFPPTNTIYTGGGRITALDPDTLMILDSRVAGVHWLATDNTWIYRLNYWQGLIQVVDPLTLDVVFTKRTDESNLHYGIVQDGHLWVAHEGSPGVVGRYDLFLP